jgi:TPR repeat protein
MLFMATSCHREDEGHTPPQLAQSEPASQHANASRALPSTEGGSRPIAAARIVATTTKYADRYPALSALAESGDASAAFQLYEDLKRCASAEAREEAMEALAAESGDKALVSNIVASLSEDRVVCAGLSDEQLAARDHWIDVAARLGQPEAQLAYFSVATEKFDTPEKVVANIEEIARIKTQALIYLTSAAEKGNRTAIFNLANHYHDGTLARRDPVKAYAYMRLLQQRGGVDSATKYLDLWRRDMTTEQVMSAEAIAADANKGRGARLNRSGC